MEAVLYVHGKGGSAAEAARYKPLFPDCEVVGLDWRTFTPWDAGAEIRTAVEDLRKQHSGVTLIANSIGAFFSMYAGIEGLIRKAFFISPIVDMERLIRDMMTWAGVTEAELQARAVIPTDFGEELSWEYLSWVRTHPIRWTVPTEILYGSLDTLTSLETITAFAKTHHAGLTILDGGEHWFHTHDQLRFLDDWIRETQP